MRYALVVFILLSLTSGLTLLYLTFPGNWINAFIFLVIGLTSIVAAIRYTIGKNPYGYAGFGDLAVFLFFGLVGVVGTCYLQTHSIAWINLLPASTLGLLAVGVLNINNIRDIESEYTIRKAFHSRSNRKRKSGGLSSVLADYRIAMLCLFYHVKAISVDKFFILTDNSPPVFQHSSSQDKGWHTTKPLAEADGADHFAILCAVCRKSVNQLIFVNL